MDESYGDEMAVTEVATSFERFEEQVLTQAFRAPASAPTQSKSSLEAPARHEPLPTTTYGESKRPRKFWSRV